ncbi:hypothetical protein GCM10028803_21390 [Larkinella knui]|uniref:Uncharacterized protein n=1 Tax=Larkinella knui TaxID=2025310 RepID=A0A3P1CV35_9BACT|nr:hypothetical protein [Larkinella knui]RRB17222.1 hypothetical protein EHT87_02765 [Larkinella knui]
MKRITLATAYLTVIGILALLRLPGFLFACNKPFETFLSGDQPPTLTIQECDESAPAPPSIYPTRPNRPLPDIQIVQL